MSQNVETIAKGFSELARQIGQSLSFVEGTLEGRDFLVLARNGQPIHRQRPDGRRPTKADQLLRVEPEQTKIKVSALVSNMEKWKQEIESLPPPCFDVLKRTTKAHKERTTFTGFPEAFDQHRPFLIRFIRACIESSL
jgi:hypothetical protein